VVWVSVAVRPRRLYSSGVGQALAGLAALTCGRPQTGGTADDDWRSRQLVGRGGRAASS
jgi:hypothetical protein